MLRGLPGVRAPLPLGRGPPRPAGSDGGGPALRRCHRLHQLRRRGYRQARFRQAGRGSGPVKESPACTVVAGGAGDESEGYFIRPTVVECTDPTHEVFTTEYFGPILGVYVYEDDRFEETVLQAEAASPYALTGAIFATDRRVIDWTAEALRFAAGNFYVNDKPTGAVVGQQPFGGARSSGTNDKAGSWHNLIRWTSPRSIKETFVPPTDHTYPHMG